MPPDRDFRRSHEFRTTFNPIPAGARTPTTESIDSQSPHREEDTLTMNKMSRTIAGVAAAALLVGGVGFSAVAANAAPAQHSAASKSIPAPAAAVPELFGGNTAVALDK